MLTVAAAAYFDPILSKAASQQSKIHFVSVCVERWGEWCWSLQPPLLFCPRPWLNPLLNMQFGNQTHTLSFENGLSRHYAPHAEQPQCPAE